MKDAGTAMMGIGLASGENRALDAAQQATNSNLLEASIAGASRVLFSIAGGPDLTLTEVDAAAAHGRGLRRRADANIIYGQIIDEGMRRSGAHPRSSPPVSRRARQQQSSMDFSRKDLFASTTPAPDRAVRPAAVHAAGVVLHVVARRPFRGRGLHPRLPEAPALGSGRLHGHRPDNRPIPQLDRAPIRRASLIGAHRRCPVRAHGRARRVHRPRGRRERGAVCRAQPGRSRGRRPCGRARATEMLVLEALGAAEAFRSWCPSQVHGDEIVVAARRRVAGGASSAARERGARGRRRPARRHRAAGSRRCCASPTASPWSLACRRRARFAGRRTPAGAGAVARHGREGRRGSLAARDAAELGIAPSDAAAAAQRLPGPAHPRGLLRDGRRRARPLRRPLSVRTVAPDGRACRPRWRAFDVSGWARPASTAARVADAGACTACSCGRLLLATAPSGGICGRHGAIAVLQKGWMSGHGHSKQRYVRTWPPRRPPVCREACGRDPAETCTVVAVSKTVGADEAVARRHGRPARTTSARTARDGLAREARRAFPQADLALHRQHPVAPHPRHRAGSAALVHSLFRRASRAASSTRPPRRRARCRTCCSEVNVSGEESKGGLAPERRGARMLDVLRALSARAGARAHDDGAAGRRGNAARAVLRGPGAPARPSCALGLDRANRRPCSMGFLWA